MLIDLHSFLQIVRTSLDDNKQVTEPIERRRVMESIIDSACDVRDREERERLTQRQSFRRSQFKGQDRRENASAMLTNVPLDRIETNRRLDLTS